MYFPIGTIDLRYALQAEVVADKHKADKFESTYFALVTEKQTYTFKADNAISAQQWVKHLQRAIFLSRNEGDQVKIKIPVENIVDLEESNLHEFGVALKVRAIDSEDTFSIDEYVLAFLHPSQKSEVPLQAIRKVMDSKGIKDINPEIGTERLFEELAESRRTLGRITDSTHSIGSPGTHSPVRSGSRSPRVSQGAEDSKKVSGLGRRVTRRVRNIVGRDGSRSRSSSPSRKLQPASTSSPLQNYFSNDSSILSQEDSYMEVSSEIEDRDEQQRSSAKNPAVSRDVSRDTPSVSSANLLPAFHFGKGQDADKKKKSRGTMAHKVTDMFTSSFKHFQPMSDEFGDIDDAQKSQISDDERNESNDRFRSHFSFGEEEELVATYYAHIQKPIPIYGKIYISTNFVCFRSLIIGTRTKMVLPFKDIENVSAEHGFKFGYSGLVFVIHAHEDVFFEFSSRTARDDCESVTHKRLDILRMQGSISSNHDHDSIHTPLEKLRLARLHTYEDSLRGNGCLIDGNETPAVLESRDPCESTSTKLLAAEKPNKVFHFTCVTIGSRGDVQPYIALCKGLMKEGHKCRIATHSEFKDWVESYDIEFREVAGDPGELMKIMIEHGMFSVSFLRDAASKFRGWIDQLLHTTWEACQGTDIIIESPSAMAGIHVAEALRVPYFRAFTMPWTRTRTYPHAFMVPEQKMGGSYNHLTYVLFDNVFWKGISGQVNKWRVSELGIEKTNLDLLRQSEVPFLYNVSPSVLVPPVDYPDWVRVTGYWFLDEGNADTYEPPVDLANFIAQARKDNKKLVYIGFGSIVVSNPSEMTKAVVDAVLKSGVRCILSKGWSERFGDKEAANKVEVPLPEEIFQIKAAPHDWLFPQMDAAVHHGGSGTTGASLRAGLPTIIKPFFGDQFFYASRVEDLGVGVFLKKLTVSAFSKAIIEVTTNEKIIKKASLLGAKIRKESGVDAAISLIYLQMNYAQSLIKKRDEIKDGLSIGGIFSPMSGAISRTISSTAGHASSLASFAYKPVALLESAVEESPSESTSVVRGSSTTKSAVSARGNAVRASSTTVTSTTTTVSGKTSESKGHSIKSGLRKIIHHSSEDSDTASTRSAPAAIGASPSSQRSSVASKSSQQSENALASIASRTRETLSFTSHHERAASRTGKAKHTSGSSSSEDTHKTDESWTFVGEEEDEDSS